MPELLKAFDMVRKVVAEKMEGEALEDNAAVRERKEGVPVLEKRGVDESYEAEPVKDCAGVDVNTERVEARDKDGVGVARGDAETDKDAKGDSEEQREGEANEVRVVPSVRDWVVVALVVAVAHGFAEKVCV